MSSSLSQYVRTLRVAHPQWTTSVYGIECVQPQVPVTVSLWERIKNKFRIQLFRPNNEWEDEYAANRLKRLQKWQLEYEEYLKNSGEMEMKGENTRWKEEIHPTPS